jgi:hypothetical protein
MFQYFAALDDALIERVFQPIADLISDTLGLTRSRVTAACLELAAVAWVLSQAPELSSAVLGWQAGSAFVHLVLLMLGLAALLGLRTLFRRVGTRQANPLRLTMRPHRAVVLLLLAARLAGPQATGFAAFADFAMLGLATLALYLGACATRPPVRRVFGLPQAA